MQAEVATPLISHAYNSNTIFSITILNTILIPGKNNFIILHYSKHLTFSRLYKQITMLFLVVSVSLPSLLQICRWYPQCSFSTYSLITHNRTKSVCLGPQMILSSEESVLTCWMIPHSWQWKLKWLPLFVMQYSDWGKCSISILHNEIQKPFRLKIFAFQLKAAFCNPNFFIKLPPLNTTAVAFTQTSMYIIKSLLSLL